MTNFKHAWTRHTIKGQACYFCLTPTSPPSEVPCCLAAFDWRILYDIHVGMKMFRLHGNRSRRAAR